MEKIYKLPDFYQAVILKTAGMHLIRLEKLHGRHYTFVFEDTNGQAKELLKSYWNRKLKLEARDVIENINELKTRMYSEIS